MKYLIFFLFFLSVSLANAAFLRNVPQEITLPNGQIVHCFATGDEFFHWFHDEKGFTLQIGEDGYLYYAILKNDKLICSNYAYQSVDPSIVGISPWNLIPEKDYYARRNEFQINQQKNVALTPTTGLLNNIVVFIRFSDDTEFTTSFLSYDNVFNNNVLGSNSMYNYYKEASYNQLEVKTSFYPLPTGQVVVSYVDANKRSYYQPYNATTNVDGYQTTTVSTTREHTLLSNAINAIKSQVPTTLNIDGDGDGKVDNVCFIIKGTSDAWSELLWPHMWSLPTSYNSTINTKKVVTYNFQLELSLGTTNASVLCHEMFHSLGAPDLYHYQTAFDFLNPVADWDLMGTNINPPQHMSTYMKYKYGKWISSLPLLSTPGTYTINPITSSTNNCYKIIPKNSTTEYYVVEYRKKEGAFESGIPGSGILIYRINTGFKGNAQFDGTKVFDEVYLYRPNGELMSDGSVQNAFFSQNVGRTSFTDKTNPAGVLSDGTSGGIYITNITKADNTISFNFDGGPVNLGWNAGIKYVVSPVKDCLTQNENLLVTIKNYGTNTITSANLKIGLKINGGPEIMQNYTGSNIIAGAELNYKLSSSLDLSGYQKYQVKVYTILTNDEYLANDTTQSTIINGNFKYYFTNGQVIDNTYTDLQTSGNSIVTSNFDNANSSAIDIGFPFFYNCQNFTQFILNTNGFIRLGAEIPSSTTLFFDGATSAGAGPFNSNNTKDINIISPFNHDLTAGTSPTEYRVFTSGVEGSKICTIQFKNLREKTTFPLVQYNNIEFQIKLYQGTNSVEFIYGTWTASANPSDFKTAACGLKGSTNTDGQLLMVNKGSAYLWKDVIFSNQNYESTATLNFGNPVARPAPTKGLTFKFTPTILAYTTSPTNILITKATLNGIVNANSQTSQPYFEIGQTTAYGTTLPLSAITGTGVVNQSVTSNITTLLANTTYHYRVVNQINGVLYYGNDVVFNTISSGIAENTESTLTMYPNPTKGDFYIDFADNAASNANIKVVSSLGKIIFETSFSNISNNLISLPLHQISSGIYTVIIKTDKNTIVKKIMKE